MRLCASVKCGAVTFGLYYPEVLEVACFIPQDLRVPVVVNVNQSVGVGVVPRQCARRRGEAQTLRTPELSVVILIPSGPSRLCYMLVNS